LRLALEQHKKRWELASSVLYNPDPRAMGVDYWVDRLELLAFSVWVDPIHFTYAREILLSRLRQWSKMGF
jgi:hypothetical protein